MQSESVPICQFFPMGFSPVHKAKAGKVTEGFKEIPKFHGAFTESIAELTKGLGAERGQRNLWNNKKWARVQRKLFGDLKTVLSSPKISQEFYWHLNPKSFLRENSNWIFKLFGDSGVLKIYPNCNLSQNSLQSWITERSIFFNGGKYHLFSLNYSLFMVTICRV